jgi:type II secretory pathway pseudopilin PulG
MLGRVIISLNWMVGSFALALALAGPKLLDTFLDRVNKTEAVNAVGQIAEGQQAYYALQNRYQEFTRHAAKKTLANLNVQLSLDLNSYDYDGFYGDDGAYVVRAMTRPSALRPRNSILPDYRRVGVYHQVLPASGGIKPKLQSGWVKFSGKKPGILSQFID